MSSGRRGARAALLQHRSGRTPLSLPDRRTEGGREAKYYSLTREGRRQLESETAGWKRLCEVIALVLETNK